MKVQLSQNSAEVSPKQPNRLFSIKPLKKFNVIPGEWRDITTEEGRNLSDKEIQTLWTITRIAQYSKSNVIQLSYDDLIDKAGFRCSKDQIKRYLKRISETNIIEYSVKKHRFGYKKDLVIKIDFEKLNSQGSSGVEDKFGVQTCTANMPTYKYNKNKNKEDRSTESNFFDENPRELDQLVEAKIDVAEKQEMVIEEPKIQLVVTRGKLLADFHPLSDQDCGSLRTISGREFTTNAINQILLDMSKRHKLKTPFFSKQTFLKYFARCLMYEIRDAVKVQGVDFKIKANIPKEQVEREYLSKCESNFDDLSASSLFKKKLSVSLPTETSFNLLKQYSGHFVKSGVLTVFLHNHVSLSEAESEKIIYAANEVGLSSEEKRLVNEEELGVVNTSEQKISNSVDNVLGFIKKQSENNRDAGSALITKLEIKINQKKEERKMFSVVESRKQEETTGVQVAATNIVAKITSTLKKSYSEAEYRNWFSKLTAKVNEEIKEVTLFAPSVFIKDWIESNYFGAIETIVKESNYNILITTREQEEERVKRVQQRELEKQQELEKSNI